MASIDASALASQALVSVAAAAVVAASDNSKSTNVKKGGRIFPPFLLHSHGWRFVSRRNHDVASH